MVAEFTFDLMSKLNVKNTFCRYPELFDPCGLDNKAVYLLVGVFDVVWDCPRKRVKPKQPLT